MAAPYTPTPAAPRAALALALALAGLAASTPAQAGIDPYLGALMPMAGNPPGSACPRGWAPANGQLLAIQQNTALFAILGTKYGGNGTSNFALPDLQGRAVVGAGTGPGLSTIDDGERGGAPVATLSIGNLPSHSHNLIATDTAATHAAPAADGSRTLAQAQNAGVYASTAANTALAFSGFTGQSQSVPTTSPYTVVTWCIAIGSAVFPQRP